MDDPGNTTESKAVQQAKARKAAKRAIPIVDESFIDGGGANTKRKAEPKQHRLEGTTKRVNVEITESLHQDLFMCARFKKDTVQELVNKMAEDYVAKVKKQMVSQFL